MEKLYAGVDIHKDKHVGCIVNQEGKVVREHTFPPTKEGAESFLCAMPVESVAIESCMMRRPAMKIFRELGREVKLSSAKKTHDIACRKKTDKVDAKILANLLRTGFLPEVYIPSDDILHLRDLCRHKSNLTRSRVMYQNKLKCRLITIGKTYPEKLWNKKRMTGLKEFDNSIINTLLSVRESIEKEEKTIHSQIGKISRNRKLTSLLMTVPGIAEFGALMILSEIADIKRFKTAKELVMYAGLCPGVYQTGGVERSVSNQAVNKWLKWILTECSGRATTLTGTKFQYHFAKIKNRKNAKVARRSTARKMLTIIWNMLQKEEPYHAS